jgi:hypothetical protein
MIAQEENLLHFLRADKRTDMMPAIGDSEAKKSGAQCNFAKKGVRGNMGRMSTWVGLMLAPQTRYIDTRQEAP